MGPGQSYTEAIDQPALTALFDVQVARQADSFDKCHREIVRLINLLGTPHPKSKNGPAGSPRVKPVYLLVPIMVLISYPTTEFHNER